MSLSHAQRVHNIYERYASVAFVLSSIMLLILLSRWVLLGRVARLDTAGPLKGISKLSLQLDATLSLSLVIAA